MVDRFSVLLRNHHTDFHCSLSIHIPTRSEGFLYPYPLPEFLVIYLLWPLWLGWDGISTSFNFNSHSLKSSDAEGPPPPPFLFLLILCGFHSMWISQHEFRASLSSWPPPSALAASPPKQNEIWKKIQITKRTKPNQNQKQAKKGESCCGSCSVALWDTVYPLVCPSFLANNCSLPWVAVWLEVYDSCYPTHNGLSLGLLFDILVVVLEILLFRICRFFPFQCSSGSMMRWMLRWANS